MNKLLFSMLALFSSALLAQTLNTPNYKIEITCQGPEFEVGCSKATYVGTNKKTGSKITLKGKQLMALCADGVTPCHPLGYQFKNGKIQYFVSEDGHLTVTSGSKQLLDEEGTWDY